MQASTQHGNRDFTYSLAVHGACWALACMHATAMRGKGMAAQVHKFSKFIHGTATLLPELVQAVPYWVDDESVRPSMLQSAPAPPQNM